MLYAEDELEDRSQLDWMGKAWSCRTARQNSVLSETRKDWDWGTAGLGSAVGTRDHGSRIWVVRRLDLGLREDRTGRLRETSGFGEQPREAHLEHSCEKSLWEGQAVVPLGSQKRRSTFRQWPGVGINKSESYSQRRRWLRQGTCNVYFMNYLSFPKYQHMLFFKKRIYFLEEMR